MGAQEILIDVMVELDVIKRYVANTHTNTDTEINEIRDIARRLEVKLKETDRQIDKIEQYERQLMDMKTTLKAIEKKVRTLK